MMSRKVYVGNIPWSFDDEAFKEVVTSTVTGRIISAKVQGPPRQPQYKNKGYGFIEFATAIDAHIAITTLNGIMVEGRPIKAGPAGKYNLDKKSRTTSSAETTQEPQPQPPLNAASETTQEPQSQPPASGPDVPQDIHVVGEPLIDIGCNLTHGKFRNSLPTLINRAKQAGVSHIVITGTSVPASEDANRIATSNKSSIEFYSTAGVHPHDAGKTLKTVENWESRLDEIITSQGSSVVAVGECGLDYDRMFSTKEDQQKVFRAQMRLAQKHKLPVFLHCRSSRNSDDAHQDFVTILREFPTVKACVHCMTDGSGRRLRELLDLGCYIGITGWVADHRRGADLAAIVEMIPLDRLMIETDAPFLIPLNIPSVKPRDTNEPAYLGWVVKKLADSMHLPENEIATGTTTTAKEFFGLDAFRNRENVA